MMELFDGGAWLPFAFAFLLGLSLFLYAILDGADLGVGLLGFRAAPAEREIMISSIGPFWDANETWLVLAVGLLLVAFPKAHGMVLGQLYLPVALMIIGLIFRGVAYGFRSKAPATQKGRWDALFFAGSAIATLAQGYMLGAYFVGFDQSRAGMLFSFLVSVTLACGYALMGAAWLILKTEGSLQAKAIAQARWLLGGLAACVAVVSVAKPIVTPRVLANVAALPDLVAMAPFPVIAAAGAVLMFAILKSLPLPEDRLAWVPFALTIGLFGLFSHGLVYNLVPDIVPGRLAIAEAASAPESLRVIFYGTLIVFPVLAAYTVFVHWVFRGKAQALHYD